MSGLILATVSKQYVDSSVASLSTSTSTALSSVLGGSLGVVSSAVASLSTSTLTALSNTNSSVASLSTSTLTGLSNTNSALASLSTLVGSGGGSTDLTSINSSVASLSTSTSTSLSATNSAVSSITNFRYITKTPSGGDISIELNSLISSGVLCIGIPAGTYDASTPIILKSGLDITGSGWERTVIQPKTVFSGILTTDNQVVSNARLESFSVELKRPTTNLIGDFLNVFNLTRFIYSRVENVRVFTATADVSEGVFKVRMVASADALNARSNTFKNIVVISPTVTDTGTGNAAARLVFPNNVTGMTFDESGNNNYISNSAFTGCRFPVKLGSGVNGNHFVGNSFEKFETGFSLNGAWQNNFFMQRNELGINAVEVIGAGTAPLGRNNHFYGFDYITIDNRWSALTPIATQNFQMISAYDSTSTPFLRVTTGMQGNLPMANNGIQLAGYTGYTNLSSFTNPNAVANNIAVVNNAPYFTFSSGNRVPIQSIQEYANFASFPPVGANSAYRGVAYIDKSNNQAYWYDEVSLAYKPLSSSLLSSDLQLKNTFVQYNQVASFTADTVGDIRTIKVGANLQVQNCTVANAVKGAGTWAITKYALTNSARFSSVFTLGKTLTTPVAINSNIWTDLTWLFCGNAQAGATSGVNIRSQFYYDLANNLLRCLDDSAEAFTFVTAIVLNGSITSGGDGDLFEFALFRPDDSTIFRSRIDSTPNAATLNTTELGNMNLFIGDGGNDNFQLAPVGTPVSTVPYPVYPTGNAGGFRIKIRRTAGNAVLTIAAARQEIRLFS